MSLLRGIDWRRAIDTAPSAYDVTADDRALVDYVAGAGASTYGEIVPESAGRLLRWLAPGPADVLFDLGSGAGRFVMQAVCETAVGRAVGVEISRDRHAAACATKALLSTNLDAAARAELDVRLELRCEDLRRTALRDATIVYVAATSFPAELLAAMCRRLAGDAPRLARIVSTRALPSPWNRHFPAIGELDADMSWSRAIRLHVHAAE